MPKLKTRRTALTAAIITLILLISGAAYAYWTSTGSGTGNSASGTAAVLTITPGTPTATLYPGGSATVTAKLTNSGNSDIKVSSISLASTEGTGGYDVDASHSECGLDTFTFTTQTTGWTVPASGTLTVNLTNAITMGTDTDNECQGATITVHLKVSG